MNLPSDDQMGPEANSFERNKSLAEVNPFVAWITIVVVSKNPDWKTICLPSGDQLGL